MSSVLIFIGSLQVVFGIGLQDFTSSSSKSYVIRMLFAFLGLVFGLSCLALPFCFWKNMWILFLCWHCMPLLSLSSVLAVGVNSWWADAVSWEMSQRKVGGANKSFDKSGCSRFVVRQSSQSEVTPSVHKRPLLQEVEPIVEHSGVFDWNWFYIETACGHRWYPSEMSPCVVGVEWK